MELFQGLLQWDWCMREVHTFCCCGEKSRTSRLCCTARQFAWSSMVCRLLLSPWQSQDHTQVIAQIALKVVRPWMVSLTTMALLLFKIKLMFCPSSSKVEITTKVHELTKITIILPGWGRSRRLGLTSAAAAWGWWVVHRPAAGRTRGSCAPPAPGAPHETSPAGSSGCDHPLGHPDKSHGSHIQNLLSVHFGDLYPYRNYV